jgi:hypothetical protein
MIKKSAYIFLMALFLLPITTIGQQVKHPAKGSIKSDFKIPNGLGNRVFRDHIDGLADMNLSYQRSIADFFTYGVGFQYSILRVDRFFSGFDGMAYFATPYLRLGLEKFENDILHWEITIKAGATDSRFNSEYCRAIPDASPHQATAFTLIPQVGLSLLADENLSFGVYLSYQFIFDEFHESFICADATGYGYEARDYNRPYQIFSVGLGFTYYLAKRERRDFR